MWSTAVPPPHEVAAKSSPTQLRVAVSTGALPFTEQFGNPQYKFVTAIIDYQFSRMAWNVLHSLEQEVFPKPQRLHCVSLPRTIMHRNGFTNSRSHACALRAGLTKDGSRRGYGECPLPDFWPWVGKREARFMCLSSCSCPAPLFSV